MTQGVWGSDDDCRAYRSYGIEAAAEALPFPDADFDVAISNGVLNLIPDKPAALAEIFRVLKPGGRLHVCDIGLVGETAPPDKSPWSG